MHIHVVRPGERLRAIARRYGVEPQAVAAANQLSSTEVLSVGQALLVPAGQKVHILKKGETPGGVARAYGVSAAALLEANPRLGACGGAGPGARLRIPEPERTLYPAVVNGCVTAPGPHALAGALPGLTWLSPCCFRVEDTGTLIPGFFLPPEAGGAAALMTVSNLREDGRWSGEAGHRLLTDREVQEAFFENLAAELSAGAWQGVHLDLRQLPPWEEELYNRFLGRLAELLHSEGCLLLTALAPKGAEGRRSLTAGAHDYAFHGKTADFSLLRTGGAEGPGETMAALREVLDYAVSAAPPEKLLLEIPCWGSDRLLSPSSGRPARRLTAPAAVAMAGAVGAEIHYSDAAQRPWFRYTDSGGNRHEVWFEDARSLEARLRLAPEYGLAGVSFQNLDFLYKTNFLVMEQLLHVERQG